MKTGIIKPNLFVLAVILVVAITFMPYPVRPVYAGEENVNNEVWALTGFQWSEDQEPFEIENDSQGRLPFRLPFDHLIDQNGFGMTIEDYMDEVWDLSFDMVYPKALGNWLEDLMEALQDPSFDWMKDSQRFFWGRLWVSWLANQCRGASKWPGFGFPRGFFPNQRPEFVVGQTYEADFPVDGHDGLNVEAMNGEVTIRGQEDTDSVLVTAYLTVGADSEEDAEMYMEDLDILVTDNANEILIQTIQPEDFKGRSYKIQYDIIVPSDFEVTASQDNGRITIRDIENNVDVWNGNGYILLSDIAGGITAGVDNGRIKGVMVQPDNKTIDLSTTNGGIELHISSTSTSAEISATVVNGNIRVSNLDISDVVKRKKRLTGVIGDGEGVIELNTVNGHIAVIGFD
jgi:hypothetical protein